MARPRVEAERRRALVEAAIAEVGAGGSTEVTVERIARRAGVSPALAHHYFGSKECILIAAMRAMLVTFGLVVRARLREAHGARARLDAVIGASFDESRAQPQLASAWLVFHVLALRSPRAARLLRIHRRRMRSTVLHDLRRLVPAAEAVGIAAALCALIDGLHVRSAPALDAPAPGEAASAARAYLDAVLAPWVPVCAPPAKLVTG